MAVKSSGTLSFDTDIVGEFKGTKPHALSEYYSGGANVPTGTKGGNPLAVIPTSGTIKFSDFYGATAAFVPPAADPAFYSGAYDVFTRPDGRKGVILKTSGTLTLPNSTLIKEYLVIGGGGSGSDNMAGGGAGGYVEGSNLPLGTSTVVTIGTGGVRGPTAPANDGKNTVIAGITAYGGGHGGAADRDPGNGGSGGGTSDAGAHRTPGSGTAGQGNKGGVGSPTGGRVGGGGGGAGSAGADGHDSGTGGEGGAGRQSAITGAALWYAGGGGGAHYGSPGANGGSGVGGQGWTGGSGSNVRPVANTGSGGGGTRGGAGQNGADGVVILVFA
jgi:hypothetical protein